MENFQNFKKKYLDFTPLARGGQKQVYKAESSKYGNVVVKLYFNVGDPRSEREIDIGLNKNFNNVPKIFETGYLEIEGEKTLYIVEQRVNGELLRAKIQRNDYLNLKEAVIFLEQGLTFIEQLEKENIVHRDIKPENIIVDNNGIVYFLDFGIARVLGQPSLTQTEAMFGPHTPGYAAPEQFNNLKSNIDSRTDLFSIGVVTYECITGHNPFREGAGNAMEVLQRTETITPIVFSMMGDMQKQFMALLSSLMAKYPSRRPNSANQALGWLNAAKSTFEY